MPMESKNKVLIVGSTGYIGTWITKASLESSSVHRTVVLVGPQAHSDIRKLHIFLEYKQAGATMVEASMDDHEALVSVLAGVDYVVSAIAESQLEQQLKLIRAVKQVGTIKRFLPSEYGMDPDCMEHALRPVSETFEHKRRVRRAIEESGIPFTYVVAHCTAGYFLAGLGHFGRFWPPNDKVLIYGDGRRKAIWVTEEDIGRYSIKAMADPRTLNRTIYIKPPTNVRSQMEVVNLWEAVSGKTLQKEHVSEKQWLQKLEDNNLPGRVRFAVSLFYHIFFTEDLLSFPVCRENEATSLFPEIRYADIESYLATFI